MSGSFEFPKAALAERYRVVRALGALREAAGDTAAVAEHETEFPDLCRGADPEFAPVMTGARDAPSRLAGEGH